MTKHHPQLLQATGELIINWQVVRSLQRHAASCNGRAALPMLSYASQSWGFSLGQGLQHPRALGKTLQAASKPHMNFQLVGKALWSLLKSTAVVRKAQYRPAEATPEELCCSAQARGGQSKGERGLRAYPELLLRWGQCHGKRRTGKGLSRFLVSCMQSHTHTHISLCRPVTLLLSWVFKKKRKNTHTPFFWRILLTSHPTRCTHTARVIQQLETFSSAIGSLS